MAHHPSLWLVSRLSLLAAVSLGILLLVSCLGLAEAPVSSHLPTLEKGRGVELASILLDEVFPVFYRYYGSHPLGVARLVNHEKTTITDIKLSFFAKQLMDGPMLCPTPAELGPGERRDVGIFALLSSQVLGVTEVTELMAQVVLQYRMGNQPYSFAATAPMRIQSRNAMELSDIRRLAAFVTVNDPELVGFSRNVAASIRHIGNEGMDVKLRLAIGLFSALDLLGVACVPSAHPTSAKGARGEIPLVLVQFPRQTIEYRGGDSADLAVLYAALLESVGVKAAFVTVPGRIYVALALASKPDGARGPFPRLDDAILRGDEIWAPVDMTHINDGFLKAWQAGAKQWRESAMRNQAGIFPLQEAWQEYEPVQLPGGMEIALPDRDAIVGAFLLQAEPFGNRENGG